MRMAEYLQQLSSEKAGGVAFEPLKLARLILHCNFLKHIQNITFIPFMSA